MYQRILVPLDGSETAESGLQEAIGLAAELKARLVLLHIVDDFTMLVEMSAVSNYQDMLKGLRHYGLEVLNKAKHAAENKGVHVETVLREVAQVRVADVIVAQVKQHHCELIVMGTHGRRGFSRMALGSNAELVARTSPVPVLLVRKEEAAES